jgi:arginase
VELVRGVVDQESLAGYWLHIDVDVLDSQFMPAVDSPSEGGLTPTELADLLAELAPRALGAQVTVFDPDLDPTGDYARLLTEILVSGLGRLGQGMAPPISPGGAPAPRGSTPHPR